MNLPDPAFSLSLISKIANSTAKAGDDQSAILHGFVDYLQKEAGLTEAETFGVVWYFAEQEFQKQADPLSEGVGAAHTVSNALKPSFMPPTPQPGSTDLGASLGIVPDDGTGHLPEQPSTITPKQTDQANTLHHVISPIVDAKKQWGEGNYMGALASGAKGLGNAGINWAKNPANLKAIAPYAVPGIASYLAGRASGQGQIGSAAMGVLGGAAGAHLWNNNTGGIKDSIKGLMSPTSHPADAAPAQPVAADPVKQQATTNTANAAEAGNQLKLESPNPKPNMDLNASTSLK